MINPINKKSKVITLVKTRERTSDNWKLMGVVAVSASLYLLTNWLIFLKF